MKRFLRIMICPLLIASMIAAMLPFAAAASGFYSTAELLEIKSHIEKDADMGTFATTQGACTDGVYAYFAVQSGSTVILKYNMSTWELRKKAAVSGLGHANDMAYNPNRKLLVVANNDSEDDCLTLVDPDSLKVKGTVTPYEEKTAKQIKKEAQEKGVKVGEIDKKRKLKVYCVAYNAARDNYVVGLSGSYKFALLNGDFKLIRKFDGVNTGLMRQGCDCDDDYIYFAQSGGSNAVVVYNYSGDKVGMTSLNHSHEVENLFHVGDSFYLTLHYYGNFVHRVGLSDKTQIRFTVRYDSAGGTGQMKNSSVHYGTPTKLRKNAYKKPGYFFGGWTVRRGNDGKYIGYRLGSQKREWLDANEMNAPAIYADESKVAKLVKFGGAILTATWINERYEIDFDSDSGDGWMASASVEYDEYYSLPPNSFVRQGYIFSGYSASRDIDGRVFGYREGSDSLEWLRPEDIGRTYLFAQGENISRMTSDGRVVFTAHFTFAFRYNDSMDTLTGYIGNEELVEIPNAEGKLRTIGSGAFSDKTMRELRIPSSVRTIEKDAVSGCKELEAIYFVNSLPESFDHSAVSDSGSPMVYLVRGGMVLCLGFYADRHSAPLILSNYNGFERGYFEYLRGMMKRSGELARIQ